MGAVLLTRNEDDFAGVPDLQLQAVVNRDSNLP